jgi:hypothetical protein
MRRPFDFVSIENNSFKRNKIKLLEKASDYFPGV